MLGDSLVLASVFSTYPSPGSDERLLGISTKLQ